MGKLSNYQIDGIIQNGCIREKNDRDGGNKNKKRYLSPVPE